MKQVQEGDRNKAINSDVAKLTKADILWEALFQTWIANLVMVKNTMERDTCVSIILT